MASNPNNEDNEFDGELLKGFVDDAKAEAKKKANAVEEAMKATKEAMNEVTRARSEAEKARKRAAAAAQSGLAEEAKRAAAEAVTEVKIAEAKAKKVAERQKKATAEAKKAKLEVMKAIANAKEAAASKDSRSKHSYRSSSEPSIRSKSASRSSRGSRAPGGVRNLVLRYAMLISMRQQLEDKIKDTKETADFIEPYKCVSEFIGSQYARLLHLGKTKEMYGTVLGCMSQMYGMKHMFKEQRAIVRLAVALTGVKPAAANDPTLFLDQVTELVKEQPNQKSFDGKVARAWTLKYGTRKKDRGPQYNLQHQRGEASKGFEVVSGDIDIPGDLLGWKPMIRTPKRGGGTEGGLLVPPPVRNKNKAPDENGLVSREVTRAYFGGFCYDPKKGGSDDGTRCRIEASELAEMRITGKFWHDRLKPFIESALGENTDITDQWKGAIRDGTAKKLERRRCSTDANSGPVRASKCKSHCEDSGGQYCDGMNSLVKRVFGYTLPKATTNDKFNRLIVDLKETANKVKQETVQSRKDDPESEMTEKYDKLIKQRNKLYEKQKTQANDAKKAGRSTVALTNKQKVNKVRAELQMLRGDMKMFEARERLRQSYWRHKGFEESMKSYLDDAVGTWRDLTPREKSEVLRQSEVVLRRSEAVKKLMELVNKPNGTTAKNEKNEVIATVVPLSGDGKAVIVQSALKDVLSKSVLRHATQPFIDLVHGGEMQAVGKVAVKNAALDKQRGQMNTKMQPFLKLLRDINSSHTVVTQRIARRKARRYEEFTRKMKSSTLSSLAGVDWSSKEKRALEDIRNNLKSMFDQDRRMRAAYQFAADDCAVHDTIQGKKKSNTFSKQSTLLANYMLHLINSVASPTGSTNI